MNNKRLIWKVSLLLLGIGLIGAGIFLLSDAREAITGVCIGIGAALVSRSMVDILLLRYYEKHPELKKQQKIEKYDERMVAIRNKAKAKVFDIMVYVLMVLPFLMILAELALWMVLTVIGIYLSAYFLLVYLTIQYSKKM